MRCSSSGSQGGISGAPIFLQPAADTAVKAPAGAARAALVIAEPGAHPLVEAEHGAERLEIFRTRALTLCPLLVGLRTGYALGNRRNPECRPPS